MKLLQAKGIPAGVFEMGYRSMSLNLSFEGFVPWPKEYVQAGLTQIFEY